MDKLTWILGLASLLVPSSQNGPAFLLEPPSLVVFSNSKGSQVFCSAIGTPTPRIDWLHENGQPIISIPGLRQLLDNGTLYFPSFAAENFRKDVHSAIYKCRASNAVGIILSRDVHVKAVVNRMYEIMVSQRNVTVGNTAVLKCTIPILVRDHVVVTSWFRNDSVLLPGNNLGGKYIVTYGKGDLHIRSTKWEDKLTKYSCATFDTLFQEQKRSKPVELAILGATGVASVRISNSAERRKIVSLDSPVYLTCPSDGNPPPHFKWFREMNGILYPLRSLSRYEVFEDIVYIKKVRFEDAGRWTCKISNRAGEQRLDIHVTVTSALIVQISPPIQVINSGDVAVFNCSASGGPIERIRWFRNGESIQFEKTSKLKLLTPLILAIDEVGKHDRGMYQCLVANNHGSAQASAELRLKGTYRSKTTRSAMKTNTTYSIKMNAIPEMQNAFIEQAMRPGPQVSLRCSANGNPTPYFQWLLDGQPFEEIKSDQRFALGQFVDYNGDVVSHLNISNVRVEDGGLYTCLALNSLGSAQHSARLNIYGPAFIRTIGPVKAVAGGDVTLHCPYYGYPIGPVNWQRHDTELAADLRHRIHSNGSLIISNVDPAIDSGYYTCYINSKDGEVAKREIQLMVHIPPVVAPFSFPANLQEGGRAQASCFVTVGDLPIHFSWFKDGIPISASFEVEQHTADFYSILNINKVSAKHSGWYTCVASNNAATTNYTAQLVVKVAPRWEVEPQDVSVLLGNSVLVDCLATGFPDPNIKWLKGHGKSAGDYQELTTHLTKSTFLNNGSLWFQSANSQDEGYYLCQASNGIGPGLVKVIYISVNEPVIFDLPSKNVSAKRGNSALLYCHVYGDDPISLTWTFNGNNFDFNNSRYRQVITKSENTMKSQITITQTDREDSGVYKCLAENAFGRNEHTINLSVQERPDPPSMLEVVEVSSRSVKLAWRHPYNGNSPIISYCIQYQPLDNNQLKWDYPGTSNITIPITHMRGNSINVREEETLSGLQPATIYRIRMFAINSIDQSVFSETIIAKTQEEEPSAPPGDVRVEALTSGDLLVSWSKPPRESWNGEILGYVVSWKEHEAFENLTKSMMVRGYATNKFQISDLKKFTKYDIWIKAYNSVASGPPSPIILGITKEGVPEAPPSDITCSEISSQIMKISWLPPPDEFHGGIIQGYKVYYRAVTNDTDVPAIGEVKRTSSTETYLHGLYKYTNYSIAVLAYTTAGDGAISKSLMCATEEDFPGSPANIKALPLTGESILVSWLPPIKPNGKIRHYTIYCRESTRPSKQVTHVISIEDLPNAYDLSYEIRSLFEKKIYDFWVSATNSIGEGESTKAISQAPNFRAPSRIASFSQVLQKPFNSKVILPCRAVGNPTPRTRWIYRDRPITFSPFFEVSNNGHLKIHRADPSLSGNYSCSASNLFGEDNITYTLIVLLPPSAPSLGVQYTTETSIRMQWSFPENGGSPIQGFTLNLKHKNSDWTSQDVPPESNTYTLNDLKCGSEYHVFIIAFNRIGKGSPSSLLAIKTKGGVPALPKEKDFIISNTTSLMLNLSNWPNNGCPIHYFSVQYRTFAQNGWTVIGKRIVEDATLVLNLTPATWYQLNITAENDAGVTSGLFKAATASLSGGPIPEPPNFQNNQFEESNVKAFKNIYAILGCIGITTILTILIIKYAIKKKKRANDTSLGNSGEKVVESDNIRSCHQVYTSSPTKSSQKLSEDASGMYEISPYATFNVPGNATTLDYTVQFKTFGHIEDNEHNTMYPKIVSKKSISKHHYYTDATCPIQGKNRREIGSSSNRGDSESDDTSGSQCTDCPRTSNYRVPVKSPKVLFRPDSSTESNEISPINERKIIQKSLGTPRKHHRSSNTSR